MFLSDLISSTSFTVTKNVSTTVDPTVNDDINTGISVFSVWQNTATGRIFDCKSNAVGAANWVARVDASNIASFNIVTSNTALGGANTVRIQNIVAVSNTNYAGITTPNANTAYFIDG